MAARLIKPGHAQPVANLVEGDPLPKCIDHADNLMTGNGRQAGQGQVALNNVQVGMANTAGADFQPYLAGAGLRGFCLGQRQRGGIDRGRLAELHGFHKPNLFSKN